MNLTKEERETAIRSSAVDQTWDCVTADDRWITYLKRMGYQFDTDHQFPAPYAHFSIPWRDLRVSRFGRTKRKAGFLPRLGL